VCENDTRRILGPTFDPNAVETLLREALNIDLDATVEDGDYCGLNIFG